MLAGFALQVETTCGPTLLQQCFLPRSSIDSSLVQLMTQLQLPCLQLPDADNSRWDFLQRVGVSMELKWPTLLKILQQLSSSDAAPALASMQHLYKSINALEALGHVTAIDLRAAFGRQKLVYVPGRQSGKGSWRSSGEVFWKAEVGSLKHYPHIVFIEESYKVRTQVWVQDNSDRRLLQTGANNTIVAVGGWGLGLPAYTHAHEGTLQTLTDNAYAVPRLAVPCHGPPMRLLWPASCRIGRRSFATCCKSGPLTLMT